MMTETAPRNPFKTGHLPAPAPAARLTLEQVRWCPRCRRYRGPAGRFLTFETVRRLAAAHRAEARRVATEWAVAATFGRRIAESRARQTAALLFDTPRPAVPAPPTRCQTRAARTAAILFDAPMPTTPCKPTRAEAQAAHTARLLFG